MKYIQLLFLSIFTVSLVNAQSCPDNFTFCGELVYSTNDDCGVSVSCGSNTTTTYYGHYPSGHFSNMCPETNTYNISFISSISQNESDKLEIELIGVPDCYYLIESSGFDNGITVTYTHTSNGGDYYTYVGTVDISSHAPSGVDPIDYCYEIVLGMTDYPYKSDFDLKINNITNSTNCHTNTLLYGPGVLIENAEVLGTGNHYVSQLTSIFSNPHCAGTRVVNNGNLIFDIDYCLRGSAYLNEELIAGIYMGTGSKITVEDDVTLELDYFQITGCIDKWNSIVVEDGGELVVSNNSVISGGLFGIHGEDGATIDVQDSEILNCSTGIKLDEEVEIYLDNNDFDNCGTGISFNGYSDVTKFENNVFTNTNIGVNIRNADSPIRLDGTSDNENQFNSADDIGIWVDNGQATIRHNDFTNSWISIYLNGGGFTDIQYNDIGFNGIGIFSTGANIFRVSD
ncbi:MAG: hypothetical protein HKN09_07210, partial [Saprospiraceae bacterium]|nr:hypothetical protein [Saprospiraceae bacterium]